MLIRFRTQGPQDYTNYRYVIVFNTSGNGKEPLPQAQTGFTNYSYAFSVGADSSALGLPTLYEYYLIPGTANGLQFQKLPTPPNQLQFTPNSGGNGNGGESTIQFARALLYGNNPLGIATSTPEPNGSPNPNPFPTTLAQETWFINFIVTDPSGVPVDSMGLGGAMDTSFYAPFDITTPISSSIQKTAPSNLSNPAAIVTGYQVINSP